jgi:predicted  nucleic acid-binding Zn-ribbon protein
VSYFTTTGHPRCTITIEKTNQKIAELQQKLQTTTDQPTQKALQQEIDTLHERKKKTEE